MRDIYADPAPAQLFGGSDGRAAAAKRVEYYIAGVGTGCDDALQESQRFLRGIAEAFLMLAD